MRQPVGNPIEPRPVCTGFPRRPGRSQADCNECCCQTDAERRDHRYPKRELLQLNANEQDRNRGRAWEQAPTEAEPYYFGRTSPSFCVPLLIRMTVRMATMIVIVVVVFMIVIADPQAHKHAQCKQCHKDTGQQR